MAAGRQVGDRFYDGMRADPWAGVEYTSDGSGAATVRLTVPGFATVGAGGLAAAFRTLVVHGAAGDRAACAVVGSPAAAAAGLAAYPGSAAPQLSLCARHRPRFSFFFLLLVANPSTAVIVQTRLIDGPLPNSPPVLKSSVGRAAAQALLPPLLCCPLVPAAPPPCNP